MLFSAVVACSSRADQEQPAPVPAVVVDNCAPTELPLVGGGCAKVGALECGPGFSLDVDRGCTPILPTAACAKGLIAVPGDATCRPVAECGDGKWGAIPVAGTTVYVDASYVGESDGSAAKPFTAISDAINAASADAIVAIAEGTYAENVTVTRAVRLWGRCPDKVSIVGSGTFALDITASAEVHNLSITGPDVAVGVADATVLLDRVRIHDAGDRGLDVENLGKPTSVTVRDSLIESTAQIGVYSEASEVTLDRSVVRGTRGAKKGQVTEGILARGGQVSREPSGLVLRGSYIHDNTVYGVNIADSVAEITGSVVRGTKRTMTSPAAGITVQKVEGSAKPATLLVKQTLVDAIEGVGIDVASSTATIDGVTVRDITGVGAGGVLLELAEANVTNTTIVDAMGTGLEVRSAKADLSRLRVARVQYDPELSIGPGLQFTNSKGPVSEITVRETLVHDVVAAGIGAWGARLTMTDIGVHSVRAPPDGRFGDGITLSTTETGDRLDVVEATIRRAVIRDAARAGITLYAGTLRLGESVLCSPIAINTETIYATDSSGTIYSNPILLEDLGGTVCGCDTRTVCVAKSSGLAPIQR
jgi:hypothetical protein